MESTLSKSESEKLDVFYDVLVLFTLHNYETVGKISQYYVFFYNLNDDTSTTH